MLYSLEQRIPLHQSVAWSAEGDNGNDIVAQSMAVAGSILTGDEYAALWVGGLSPWPQTQGDERFLLCRPHGHQTLVPLAQFRGRYEDTRRPIGVDAWIYRINTMLIALKRGFGTSYLTSTSAAIILRPNAVIAIARLCDGTFEGELFLNKIIGGHERLLECEAIERDFPGIFDCEWNRIEKQ